MLIINFLNPAHTCIFIDKKHGENCLSVLDVNNFLIQYTLVDTQDENVSEIVLSVLDVNNFLIQYTLVDT